MRRDDDGEGLFRRRNLFFTAPPHTAKTDDEEIQGKEKDKYLHRHHDDVERMRNQKPSAFLP